MRVICYECSSFISEVPDYMAPGCSAFGTCDKCIEAGVDIAFFTAPPGWTDIAEKKKSRAMAT